MTRAEPRRAPLLSVDGAAILLGVSRSSLYRSIVRGDCPLRVFTINGRLRIPRLAVERLLAGDTPAEHRGAVQVGFAAERSEGNLDSPVASPRASHDAGARPPCGRADRLFSLQPRTAPTCSAALRSSSGTPSV